VLRLEKKRWNVRVRMLKSRDWGLKERGWGKGTEREFCRHCAPALTERGGSIAGQRVERVLEGRGLRALGWNASQTERVAAPGGWALGELNRSGKRAAEPGFYRRRGSLSSAGLTKGRSNRKEESRKSGFEGLS